MTAARRDPERAGRVGRAASRIGVGFLALSALLIAYAVVQVVREPWISDFWEHAAVVRELTTHPWAPVHPLLGIDAPDAFTSPYSLIAAAISRVAGVDSVRALGIAGVLNLVLLLAGLRLFVEAVAPARATRASFYTLLFALLLWGKDPWVYSGFFNLESLGYVLPYASTFAAGLAMIAIFAWNRWCLAHAKGFSSLLFSGIAAAIVLATHPPAFLFLAAGAAACTFAARLGVPGWTAFAATFAAGAGLAMAWPYYPVPKLLFAEQATFHQSNVYMYRRVLERMAPLVLAVPFMARSWWRNRRHSIAVMAAILAVPYVFGGITKQWNLGRAIPFIALLCQVELALAAAAWESLLEAKRGRAAKLALRTAVVAACVLLSWWWQIRPVVDELQSRGADVRGALGFLADHVPGDAVVVADFDTGWYVPAFGGKVIASRHPIAFVPGHAERIADVKKYFDASATRSDREAIARRYAARFLLVDEKAKGALPPETFGGLGRTVARNDRYRLISFGE